MQRNTLLQKNNIRCVLWTGVIDGTITSLSSRGEYVIPQLLGSNSTCLFLMEV